MDTKPQPDAFEIEIQRMSRERHKLEQRLNASGTVIDLALRASEGADSRSSDPEPDAAGDATSVVLVALGTRNEDLPRGSPLGRALRIHPFVTIVVLLFVAALAVAFAAGWFAFRAGPSTSQIQSSTSGPSAVTPASISASGGAVDRPINDPDLVIYIRAQRECSVRIGVDDEEPADRRLQEGDELVLRPRTAIVIQTDDAGALAATVNGRSIRLGRDGQAVRLRISSENLDQFPDR